jgi:hypothetical protein
MSDYGEDDNSYWEEREEREQYERDVADAMHERELDEQAQYNRRRERELYMAELQLNEETEARRRREEKHP